MKVNSFLAGAAGSLLLAITAPLPANAQSGGTETTRTSKVVSLTTDSDLDDPMLIRPVRLADGYENWLSAADFPEEAFTGKSSITGSVIFGRFISFDLHVGADDKLIRCEISPRSAEYAGLLERACGLIRDRGRFVHGIDRNGTAQPSKRAMTLRFLIISSNQSSALSPAPFADGYRNTRPALKDQKLLMLPAGTLAPPRDAASIWVDIDERGRVTKCRIARQGTGTDPGDALLCKKIEAARFEPARDPNGKKMPTRGHYITFKEK